MDINGSANPTERFACLLVCNQRIGRRPRRLVVQDRRHARLARGEPYIRSVRIEKHTAMFCPSGLRYGSPSVHFSAALGSRRTTNREALHWQPILFQATRRAHTKGNLRLAGAGEDDMSKE